MADPFDYSTVYEAARRPEQFDSWLVQHDPTTAGDSAVLRNLNWIGYHREHLRAEFDQHGPAKFYKLLDELQQFDQGRRDEGRVRKTAYCISGTMRLCLVDMAFTDPGGMASSNGHRKLLNEAFPRLRPPEGYAAVERLRDEFGVKCDRR
jgi:hypothetical protein